MNVILFGQMATAHLIKDLGWDHPELPGWALHSMTSVLIKDRKGENTIQRKGNVRTETTVQRGGPIQESLNACSHHQMDEDSPLELREGVQPCQ